MALYVARTLCGVCTKTVRSCVPRALFVTALQRHRDTRVARTFCDVCTTNSATVNVARTLCKKLYKTNTRRTHFLGSKHTVDSFCGVCTKVCGETCTSLTVFRQATTVYANLTRRHNFRVVVTPVITSTPAHTPGTPETPRSEVHPRRVQCLVCVQTSF